MIKVNNKHELESIIRDRIKSSGNTCDLNDLDVSGIRSMSGLFRNTKFNGDISKWMISKSSNTSFMFE